MVPEVVRLERAGVCSCGELVAAGERAGYAATHRRVWCLSCLAEFSAGPEDQGLDDARLEGTPDTPDTTRDTTPDTTPDSPVTQELPAPVTVVIPADWAPPAPTSLPSWQRAAGVKVALPPAAAVQLGPVAPPVPAVAVQFLPPSPPQAVAEPATRHTADAPAPPAPPAPSAPLAVPAEPMSPPAATAPSVAVSVEAAAMTVPSHRRRTILPAGLLALRPSRGRAPRSTGHADAATRALLEAARKIGVLSLHDRRMPGRRGHIAHLAFGAGGVFVIDVVRAKNASIEVRPVDELDPDAQELVVGGRLMTPTVTATQGRVAIVRALLDEVELSTVRVRGVICVVDAAAHPDATLEVDGVHVIARHDLPALLDTEGALDPEHRETLREYLTERLPSA